MDKAWLSGASGSAPTAPASPSIGFPTAGNPGVTPATVPGAWWYHMVTSELLNLVTTAGITPSQSNLTQVKAALDALYGTVLTNAGIPYGVKLGALIVQFKQVTFTDVPTGTPGLTGSVTWGTAFPTACLAITTGFEATAGASSNWAAAITAKSTTGCSYQIQEWASATNPGTLTLIAIGY